jgi:hypothetical protein
MVRRAKSVISQVGYGTNEIVIDATVQELFTYRIPKAYISTLKQYIKLATESNWRNDNGSLWPISITNLMKYLAYKSQEVAPHTLRSYLCGLAYCHKLTKQFHWDQTKQHPAVQLLLKNATRKHIHKRITQSQHMTIDMVRLVRSKLDLKQEEHLMFWAIFSVAFYSMARLSELVLEKEQDTASALTLGHIKIEETKEAPGVSILLPRSKCHDPAVPAILCVEPTYDDTCPLQALLSYLLLRRTESYAKDSKLLFCYKDGKPVTRRQFMTTVHDCIPGANIDARSFRSGGATFWKLKGMPDLMIQREGRWSSAAFQRYIRYTVPLRKAIRNKVALQQIVASI